MFHSSKIYCYVLRISESCFLCPSSVIVAILNTPVNGIQWAEYMWRNELIEIRENPLMVIYCIVVVIIYKFWPPKIGIINFSFYFFKIRTTMVAWDVSCLVLLSYWRTQWHERTKLMMYLLIVRGFSDHHIILEAARGIIIHL